jgi:hypothetical protein
VIFLQPQSCGTTLAKAPETVNRRIHDGVPLEALAARGQSYVDQIFGLFPCACLKDGASVMEIGSSVGYIMEAMDIAVHTPGKRFKHVDIRDSDAIWFLIRCNEPPLPTDFDPRCCLELNPDIAAAGANPAAHWKEFGYREGRHLR